MAGLDQKVLEQCCAEAEKKEAGGVCRIANALFPKGFSCAGTEKAWPGVRALMRIREVMRVGVVVMTSGSDDRRPRLRFIPNPEDKCRVEGNTLTAPMTL